MRKKEIKKVLFYTNLPRFFRTTLIGNLYEISQTYPTVLLSEKLDPQTEEVIRNKALFPKLEEVVPVHQYTGEKMNLFKRHRYFCKLARTIIQNHQPNIVIVTGNNFFESYLRRFAREKNAFNIFFVRLLFRSAKLRSNEYIFKIAYFKAPKFLPARGKILFSKLRTYLGHFFCYWILPLINGQRPFVGEPSCVLMEDNSRFRGIDYFIVFSKKNYDILKKDGLPPEKLYILAHPLARDGESKKFFKEIYFVNNSTKKSDKKILTLMWRSDSIGFRRDNYSFISQKEMWQNNIEIVNLIAKTLKDWRIFIKPHPDVKETEQIEKTVKSISDDIEITGPLEPLDKYIGMSDVIVGLSPRSTTYFDAFLQNPEKPILALDLQHEFGGDSYKDFEGVDWVDSKEKFINILELIRDGKYQKNYQPKYEKETESKEFSDAVEMVNCLSHTFQNTPRAEGGDKRSLNKLFQQG